MSMGVPAGTSRSLSRAASCSRMQPCEMRAPVAPITWPLPSGPWMPITASPDPVPVADGVGVSRGDHDEGPVARSGLGRLLQERHEVLARRRGIRLRAHAGGGDEDLPARPVQGEPGRGQVDDDAVRRAAQLDVADGQPRRRAVGPLREPNPDPAGPGRHDWQDRAGAVPGSGHPPGRGPARAGESGHGAAQRGQQRAAGRLPGRVGSGWPPGRAGAGGRAAGDRAQPPASRMLATVRAAAAVILVRAGRSGSRMAGYSCLLGADQGLADDAAHVGLPGGPGG